MKKDSLIIKSELKEKIILSFMIFFMIKNLSKLCLNIKQKKYILLNYI